MTAVLSFALAILLTSSVSAQAGHETSLARALFEEGVAMADTGDWEGAADRFSRALVLKPTPGIAFNLASALSETGKLTQASELWQGIVRDPSAEAALRQESEQKLQTVAARMARLTLRVDPALADSIVEVDGNAWPRQVWDVAIPVDPGAHVVTSARSSQELVRAELTLEEGEQRELLLAPPVEAVAPEVVALTPPPTTSPRGRSERPLYKSWVLWTAVGVAVVGGVVAAAVLSSKGDETRFEPATMGNTGPGVLRW